LNLNIKSQKQKQKPDSNVTPRLGDKNQIQTSLHAGVRKQMPTKQGKQMTANHQ